MSCATEFVDTFKINVSFIYTKSTTLIFILYIYIILMIYNININFKLYVKKRITRNDI